MAFSILSDKTVRHEIDADGKTISVEMLITIPDSADSMRIRLMQSQFAQAMAEFRSVMGSAGKVGRNKAADFDEETATVEEMMAWINQVQGEAGSIIEASEAALEKWQSRLDALLLNCGEFIIAVYEPGSPHNHLIFGSRQVVDGGTTMVGKPWHEMNKTERLTWSRKWPTIVIGPVLGELSKGATEEEQGNSKRSEGTGSGETSEDEGASPTS